MSLIFLFCNSIFFNKVLSSARLSINDSSNSENHNITKNRDKNNDNNELFLPIKSFYPNSFDRILLDPPCSALGLRPKLQLSTTNINELKVQLPSFQKLFIQNAISLLKPGGIMTYSTCTINKQENECMVKYVLDTYSDCIMLVDVGISIGNYGLKNCGLSDEERGMVRRFDPCLENDDNDDSNGFFIAKFHKKID